MKFRGKDPAGITHYGSIEGNVLTVYDLHEGEPLPLYRLKFDRYVNDDANGKAVYQGDTVILPKGGVYLEDYGWFNRASGEYKVPRVEEPHDLTWGEIAKLVSKSTLKE